MKILLQLYLTTILISAVFTLNFFNLRLMPKTSNAKCLDGTPFGLYIYEPDPVDVKPSNKLLIYFQETPFGWCAKQDQSSTLQECHKFITQDNLIDFGSTQNWAGSITYLSGILSPFNSGDFNSYHKVLFKSCDGGSYFGNRDPIKYKGKNLFFRGSKIVEESFAYLKKIGWLDKKQIVIAGSFNGGFAALHWYPLLKTMTQAPIRVIADCVSFINETNYLNQRPVIENRMKMVDKVFLDNTTLPNSACVKAYPNEQWKCLFIEWLYPYLDRSTEMFYTQSSYDGWEIEEVLGFKCAADTASLSQCTKEHQQVIQNYHKNVTNLFTKILASSSNWSGFAISCVGHKFLNFRWEDEEYEVPMKSGNNPMKVVDEWVRMNVTKTYIDDVEWPGNTPCAHQRKQIIMLTNTNLKVDEQVEIIVQ